MEKTKRNRRVLMGAMLFAMAALATIAFQSGREIITRLDEYSVARSEYAKLREQFGVLGSSEPSEADGTASVTGEETEGIDFDALREINPNIVAWIVVPGTNISYPIVQGTDNAHYLHHTFRGERNASGAIFLDYRNSADFSDSQIILHGHNMRDGSMFAPLHGWAGDHFFIHTPEGMLEFEVFNRQTIEATHDIYQLHDTGNGARIVTLSTCVNGDMGMRYVVQGQ